MDSDREAEEYGQKKQACRIASAGLLAGFGRQVGRFTLEGKDGVDPKQGITG
jgi:hypothetical protein